MLIIHNISNKLLLVGVKGMIYLVLYAAVLCSLVLIREWGQKSTLDRFLVADRRVGGIIGAMSIAASWIWAPAIFVSTRIGYEWGYSGLLWFIVPNMASLMIFAPLALLVRRRLPNGYSYVQTLRNAGGGFWHAQLAVQLVMQVVIFSIQLTAGAELLATVTGADYRVLVIGMGLTPFAYTFFSGLRTSVFTDAIQYAVIAVAAVSILLAFPNVTTTLDSRPFEPMNAKLLLQFGISSSLGLIVAIFADHQQWQRAFAVKENDIIKTYWLGGLMHGLVTFCLGTLGCLIFQQNFKAPAQLELVGIEFIKLNYSSFFVPVFIVMALCALISTLDAGLCAFSSLVMTEGRKSRASLSGGRKIMFSLACCGMLVAIGHLSLISLWFLAGTIRLSSFIPTVVSILSKNFRGSAGTLAITAGLLIGGAVFGRGVFAKDAELRTLGMVLSIGISGFVCMLSMLLLKFPLGKPVVVGKASQV